MCRGRHKATEKNPVARVVPSMPFAESYGGGASLQPLHKLPDDFLSGMYNKNINTAEIEGKDVGVWWLTVNYNGVDRCKGITLVDGYCILHEDIGCSRGRRVERCFVVVEQTCDGHVSGGCLLGMAVGSDNLSGYSHRSFHV